jgi:hypothetical protein
VADREPQEQLDPRVVISLASYMADGRPVQTRSLYAALRQFDPTTLTAALRARTGVNLHVSLLHDGTDAANAIAVSNRDAVILLGTNLGVGLGVDFDAAPGPRLQLASNFTVEPEPRV